MHAAKHYRRVTVRVDTVAGRLDLIKRLEDINAGLHQLDLHVRNLEHDLDVERRENRVLRETIKALKAKL
jgi:5-methylcytosine-specific restriction endonuclease McrBC regulatory subunit McrC